MVYGGGLALRFGRSPVRMRWTGLLCLMGLFAASPASAQALDDPAGLRAAALAAVNQDRMQRGFPPLRLDAKLNAAAQAHANDMLRRRYFDHASPEGRMVSERFQQHGGSRWMLVAENIAQCTACPVLPGHLQIRQLEQDWMGSPTHRANILRHGLTGFGFGIAGLRGNLVYSVQTFAGPGVPLDTEAPEPAEIMPPDAQVTFALQHFNAARQAANLPPLQVSHGLTALARAMVSNNPEAIIDRGQLAQFNALSSEGSEWQEVALESSRCGGCGLRPTAPDVSYFAREFLHRRARDANPLAPAMDVAGFAMAVNGAGMKSAVLLVGRRR